ncbi:MAG: hypothetical protein IJM35_07420 [Bacteroidales bacterium]|nr:hypothetical protein [Bacteroidales bacterium]
MKKILILFILLSGFIPVSGKVRLPHLIGNHMVLQRDTMAGIWGEAAPGRRVTVHPSWSRKHLRTTADSAGHWSVLLPTPGAGGPYSLVIDDGDKTVLDSIMIGEVWVCSGQSNMALTLHGERGEYVEGALQTLLEAGRYPSIRFFKMGYVSTSEPQDDCPGYWAVPNWTAISDFSAVAYHFGRTLTDALGIPVGLISASWGASSIEAWMSPESLNKLEQTDSIRFPVRKGMMKQKIPSALYNGMIHPLMRFTARGFIWYQGEGNRANYKVYDKLTAEMVKAWRDGWNNPYMPFYSVELTPFRYDDPQGIDRPLLVEAQHRAVRMIPHSGIAGTLDLGDSTNIHAPRKIEIGQRLALLALTQDYGVSGIEARGPVFQTAEFGSDGSVTVTFSDAPFGLRFQGLPSGFEICGEDRVFVPAEASIIHGRSAIRITSKKVPHPVAARYGFRNWCRGNLYNTSGIPVAPFRTDGDSPYEKLSCRIYTLGDSNGEKHDGWVDRLKIMLPGATIHNNSRSGRTIGFDNNGDRNLNALKTIDGDMADAGSFFGDPGCDVIIVCLGTNDAKAAFSDRQQEVAENFDRLLGHISDCDLVIRSKPVCIFVTPPPMDDRKAGTKYTGGNGRLASMIPHLKEIARKNGWEVIDIYHPLQSVFGLYSSDGVHMGPDGQQIVAQKIADLLVHSLDF